MWFFPPPEDAIHRRTLRQRIIYTALWPILSRITPWVCSSIEDIARVAMDLAMGKLDEHVIGSARLKVLGANLNIKGREEL
jgi:hypothetical protein